MFNSNSKNSKNKNLISLLFLGFAFSSFNLVIPSFALSNQEFNSIQKEGKASWIGERFQGKKTASGELFDMNDLTASHATLPLGSIVQVTSSKTKKSVNVRINNRSEIDNGRIIDLSKRAAEQIGLVEEGIGLVSLSLPLSNKIISNSTSNSGSSSLNIYSNSNNSSSSNTNSADNFQIQYASFFDLDNAIDFKTELKKKKIETEVEPAKASDGRSIYRVNSFQKFNSKLEAKNSLDALAPQQGLITAYNNSNINSTKSSVATTNTTKPITPKPAVNNSSSFVKSFEYGVQFGAFEKLDYAKEMQTKLLKSKSIKTIIYQFPDDSKKLHRVLTNQPFSTKIAANKFLEENAVSGLILTFVK
jgi:rare lipoprotein A